MNSIQSSMKVSGRRFTPEICSIAESNLLTSAGNDRDGAVLDEVHFATQRSFSYDEICGLKDLEAKLGQDYRHEMRVSVGEERHVGDEAAAVIADDLLQTENRRQFMETFEERMEERRPHEVLLKAETFMTLLGNKHLSNRNFVI